MYIFYIRMWVISIIFMDSPYLTIFVIKKLYLDFFQMDQHPMYTLETAIAAIKSHDVTQLNNLLHFMQDEVKTDSELVKNMASSPDFFQALSDMVSEFKSEEILSCIYQLAETFLPILPDQNKVEFIDSGIEFCLPEALNSKNTEFILKTVDFVIFLARQTEYAIDSLFSFGIHTQLLDIAEKNMTIGGSSINRQVADHALTGVFTLFGMHQNILSTILQSTLPRVTQMMLDTQDVEEKKTLLKTITEITNQRFSFCFILYDCGAVPTIYKMLDDPNYITTALPLIGNLCLSSREHVEELISMGLPEKLTDLLKQPEYAVDAYWCLSNLTEAAPDLVSKKIVNEENMSKLLDKILKDTLQTESISLKKEATFFLATLIMYVSRNYQHAFIKKGIFESLVSCLEITDDNVVVTRILNVFNRFMIHVGHNFDKEYEPFNKLVNEFKLLKKVDRIAHLEDQMLVTKAHEVINQYKELTEFHK